jgi:hypothetical protein
MSTKLDPFLHHPDGRHRSTCATTNGRDLERFEAALPRHLADGHGHLPAAELRPGDRVRFWTADGALHDITVSAKTAEDVTIRDGRGRRFGLTGDQPVTVLAAVDHRRFPERLGPGPGVVVLPPGGRWPYVGEGADGCEQSAQIDREEAATLWVGHPRRETLAASAARWELQAAWHRAAGEVAPGSPTA